ncbi:MAG: anti-sigma factor [Opitutaceae bacterium]|nr:anti-sigma factor [Opitutaceae bacterium]
MSADHNEELAALHAFGLLEGEELRQLQAETDRDPGLRATAATMAATACLLAHCSPDAEPPPGLKARLLREIATPPGRAPKPAPRPLTFWLPLAAAAAGVVTTVWFAQLLFVSRSENELLRQEIALADAMLRSARQQLEAERLVTGRELQDAAARVARIEGEMRAQGDLARFKIATLASLLGNSPQALAVAVWDPNAQEGILSVEKLPALAPDKDYQLWVIDPQYPIPVDGGVFSVDPQTGVARYQFKADKPVKTAAKFAVSLERKGGVPKAEGPMVLISH